MKESRNKQSNRAQKFEVNPTLPAQGSEKHTGKPTGRSTSAEVAGNPARTHPKTHDERRDAPARAQSGSDTPSASDRKAPDKDAGFTPRGMEIPTRNIGGVSGRTMNRRMSNDDEDRGIVAPRTNAGGNSGTNRTPTILQKNRKNRRAA